MFSVCPYCCTATQFSSHTIFSKLCNKPLLAFVQLPLLLTGFCTKESFPIYCFALHFPGQEPLQWKDSEAGHPSLSQAISEALLFAINGYNEESITNLRKLWGVKRDKLRSARNQEKTLQKNANKTRINKQKPQKKTNKNPQQHIIWGISCFI